MISKKIVSNKIEKMDINNTGLLVCSICGNCSIEISGKNGSNVHTMCHSCGMSSDDLLPKKKEVQIYYRFRAAATQ